MIPRLKPALGAEELCAAFHAPRRDDVRLFEQSFAALMEQKYAVAFPYGRTGLMVLLESLGLKEREIICPAYTCVVVPHAIVYSGNSPVFVDCEPGGYNMDLAAAEKKITEKTGVLIATSLFGYPVDLDRLAGIRSRHPHVRIIQDCAHSFAAQWKGRPVQKEGVAALFGLNISKTLTSVFGGMITTDESELYGILTRIRDERLGKAGGIKGFSRLLYLVSVYPAFWGPLYGLVNRAERSGLISRFVRYYYEGKIDMPRDYLQGISSLEARVGRKNIGRYADVIGRRREAAEYYFAHLNSRPSFRLPPRVEGATYSHFVAQVEDRAAWLQEGLQKDIQLGQLIEYSIPEMQAYGSNSPGAFPVAAAYSRHSINLPVWGGRNLAEKVCRAVSDSLSG
jgi:dTDP-4-amino-4,6-dideoxygalactose transaminase